MNLKLIVLSALFNSFIPTSRANKKPLSEYLWNRLSFVNDELENHRVVPREIQNDVQFFDSEINSNVSQYFNATHLLIIKDKYNANESSSNQIKFYRIINYNGLDLLYTAYERGLATIHEYAKNESTFVQKITNPNKLTDAKFFTNNGSLYLIVSSMLGVSPAPITVYKWEGAHFDEVAKVFAEGTVSLASFESDQSEIIVVLRNYGVEKSNSYVYEFSSNQLKTIQILENETPKHIVTYMFENKRYILIFDETSLNVLYWWDGSEMIPLQSIENVKGILRVFLHSIDNTSLIFALTKDSILVYCAKTNRIQLLTATKMEVTFSKILDFQVWPQNPNSYNLKIFGLEDSAPRILTISFSVTKNELASQAIEEKELEYCMRDLEDQIRSNGNQLEQMGKRTEKIIKVDEPLEFKGRVNVAAPVLAQTANIFSINGDMERKIESNLNILEEKLVLLQAQIENLREDEKVLNGKLIIQGGLNTPLLKAGNVHVKKLNGVNWTPEQWLSYTKDQSIAGFVEIQELKINDLVISNDNNNIFKDVLLKNENQTITAMATFDNLNATDVYLETINGIPMERLYLRSNPSEISGNKSFNNITIADIKMEFLNGRNSSDAIKLFGDRKASRFDFAPNLFVQNLNADYINNVEWKNFSQTVFRIGETQVIKGNITASSNLKVMNVQAKYLSGIKVNTLLTSSTNQTIDSSITFENIDAANVVVDKVNGLNFETDVARFQSDGATFIDGPVQIEQIHVAGDLHMNCSEDEIDKFYDKIHIVGTNRSDFLQMYNKVKIIGNLQVKNVHLPQSAKLFVKGNEFNQANFNDYWLKSTNQEIPVYFEAHEGITTPHLTTKILNNIPVDNYMINDLESKLSTDYVFENVTITSGNVIINEELDHDPDLQKLVAESVKLTGTYTIRGAIKFTGKLSVEHLKTDFINSIHMDNFLNKNSADITGTKIFDNLVVQLDVKTDNIDSNKLNGMDLKELFERAVFVDRPTNLDELDFTNVTAENLFTTKVNKKLFNEYVVAIDRIYLMNTLNQLLVKGNATIKNANQVFTINNIEVMKKFEIEQGKDAIDSNVTFTGPVYVKNLYALNVNRIDLSEFLPRLYYRNWPQNITAVHSFAVLSAPNVYLAQINNVDLSAIIDIHNPEVQIINAPNGLQLSNAKFLNSIQTDYMGCDINEAVNSLKSIPTAYWSSLVVNNASFLDEKSKLSELLKYGVTSNKNNTILAPVNFTQIFAKNVFTKNNINNINLQEIINDALLTNAPDQVVTGLNNFIKLRTANANVNGNSEIPSLNKIDVTKLSQSIVNKEQIHDIAITGRKTFFGGLQTNNLETPIVTGILPENLVCLSNLQPIPNVTFDSLIIENLDIGFINDANFTDFLSDRLLLNSEVDQITTAIYFLEEAEINDNSSMPSINNIPLEDVVFDEGVQIITSPKKFTEIVVVDGNVVINNLNGFDLADLYDQSILVDERADITGNIVFNEVSEMNGNVIAQSINGVSVDRLNEMMQSQNPQIRADIVHDIIQNIEGLVKENLNTIQHLPSQYLYLDKSDKLQVELPNTIDAQIVNKKDNVMIHVKSKDPGYVCGLPDVCSCPNQHTMEITQEYSINMIENKYSQRVFSFQNDQIFVHVVTTSKSSSNICTANDSALHEYTTVSWTRAPIGNLSAGSYIFPDKVVGYIADVEFFVANEENYIIMARYYDSILKSHDLDCIVFKFSPENDAMREVQRIRMKGAWTMHIFPTYQGINLVVGTKSESENYHGESGTYIYRFDRVSKEFTLLRRIPSVNCNAATSIVLNYNSFIILAHQNAPIMVMMYNPQYDNYYLVQTFIHKHPVVSVSTFYSGAIGISDAYLTAVTEIGHFYIYSYQYLAGWMQESVGQLEGLRSLVPFSLNKIPYLFASSTVRSSLLTIVKQGYN